MWPVLIIGWMVAFTVALAFSIVRRSGTAFIALGFLMLPVIYFWYGIKYGTH